MMTSRGLIDASGTSPFAGCAVDHAAGHQHDETRKIRKGARQRDQHGAASLATAEAALSCFYDSITAQHCTCTGGKYDDEGYPSP